MKKLLIQAKNNARKVGFVASGVALSSGAYAIDDTAITDAFTAANTSYGTAVAGIITLVAIGVGLGMVISAMRKS